MTPAPRVFAYLSTREAVSGRATRQVREQQDAVAQWASAAKIEVAEFVVDYGAKPDQQFGDRPQARKLLAQARRGDTIVAAGFARLFSAPEDAHAVLTQAREAACSG